MNASPWTQLKALLATGFKLEWAEKERWFGPLVFAVTMLVLFAFAHGTVEKDRLVDFYVAQTYLTAFFALQIAFARSFEPDQRDRVFILLRTYPVSRPVWFLSRYIMVLVTGVLIMAPTLLLSAFFNQEPGVSLLNWPLALAAFMAMSGCAALGVLLAVMTLSSGARALLYPILYFPLTTPVLIAGVEASRAIFENGGAFPGWDGWFALLAIFDMLYFILGLFLFGELTDAT